MDPEELGPSHKYLLRIPDPLWDRLVAWAESEERTVADGIRTAVLTFLRRRGF